MKVPIKQLCLSILNHCHTLTSWSYKISSAHYFGELIATHHMSSILKKKNNRFLPMRKKARISFNSRVEFSIEKSEGCCIYRHAGIDYIALWDSLLPLREVFATYLGTYF